MKTKPRPPLYLFNWPSNVGGADTKVTHLILLLHKRFDITVVPNSREQLRQPGWGAFLTALGVKASMLEDLPKKLRGTALSLCNGKFFTDGIAVEAKRRGLRIVWSSEMMWHHPGELGAVACGIVDKVLYVSEVQRRVLEPGYAFGARGAVPAAITGNYINARFFPFRERWSAPRRFEEFVIGRLSRPDPAKFPEDFPESYARLKLKKARFRVMAWSEELEKIYARKRFRGRWELLAKEAESQADFLHSLDLFVYDLSPRFSESWGRAVVEAMLTGCVPLVPGDARHHLRELVPHGECGYVCESREDWREFAQRLQRDDSVRRRMSRAASEFARDVLCRNVRHSETWEEALAE
jgi:glycosyltransferase involved in cell wall biosynthesis